MKIYSMTATFGKLERETLTLKPGLNIIEAPNEWGKTTWCTFLVTMLYGLDTRAKTTKNALADKEKYAPWSGSPMAGRIDLNWNGRDITIERSSKGRTPMGIFRAYETASGLEVPELTASNCGQTLLGVEQSVFRRTGFIRQSDMPVTQDDALRRRLNALVTTGDETGDSDRLAEALKDLKNKCRYNRSGLLPQAEAQRKELEEKLAELDSLALHSRKLQERLGEVKSRQLLLENHRDALLYAAAEADAARVAQARQLRDQAAEAMTALEHRCSGCASSEEAARKIAAIEAYRFDLAALQAAESQVGSCPEPPVPPERFLGMTPEQAQNMVRSDTAHYEQLKNPRKWMLPVLLAVTVLAVCAVMAVLNKYLISGILGAAGVILLVLGLVKRRTQQEALVQLEEKYGSSITEAWTMPLNRYLAEKQEYDQALLAWRAKRGELDMRAASLKNRQESLFGNQAPEAVLTFWQETRKLWTDLESARREFLQAENHLKTLQDMAKSPVRKPALEDSLTYSPADTQTLLAEARAEQQHLLGRLGQYQGRMETLGSPAALQAELETVSTRIRKLEDTYAALTLALDTLTQARQELQRKFAPRIARRAQDLLSTMTGGRYDRLSLREDLSVLSGAAQEETLHEILWRSDGTADQLYTALRLAVAEELIPDAPLILDDAFVRFDDHRLKAALSILKDAAEHRQVILFTCQKREQELL